MEVYEIKQGSPRCLYCGNNPISHHGAWLDATLGYALTTFFQNFFSFRGAHYILRYAEGVLDLGLDLLVVLHVMTFTDDPNAVTNSRGRVFFDEVRRRGYIIATAQIGKRSLDVYRLTFPNGKSIMYGGLPRVKIQGVSNAWIDDKAQLKEVLRNAGVRVSRGACFTSYARAEAYRAREKYPVITKPRFGSRGRHTTTHIMNAHDFEHGFKRAKELGHFVMVEEHLIGSVYRGTVIDGKLVGVLAGDPPRVTGDGVSTVTELIARKNREKHERVRDFVVTELTAPFLKRFGYTLDTVLKNGETIDLIEKIGLSYGGNAREVTPETHKGYYLELEKAASILQDPLLGFDFITPDITADPKTVRWGIIECNALPFIDLHHDPLEGVPINVAGIYLDYIERHMDA
jgi:D-alanine-D-alanine ligase-like ATP-grasp enzyme